MMRRRPLFWGLGLVLTSGCYQTEQKTTLVPENPFGRPPVIQAPANPTLPKSSLETAARVDKLAVRIMSANTQLGLRPKFYTIGSPQPEIFHRGSTDIYVTEGLVKQCPTEGQLASVLCFELGKIVGEREAFATPQVRLPEKSPPMQVVPGNDYAGASGPAEMLHRAEVGKYEQERRERIAAAHTPPDPQILAKEILVKSGFAPSDFDAALPLLKGAEGGALCRQIAEVPQPTLKQ